MKGERIDFKSGFLREIEFAFDRFRVYIYVCVYIGHSPLSCKSFDFIADENETCDLDKKIIGIFNNKNNKV